jgi:hypothetical protein
MCEKCENRITTANVKEGYFNIPNQDNQILFKKEDCKMLKAMTDYYIDKFKKSEAFTDTNDV